LRVAGRFTIRIHCGDLIPKYASKVGPEYGPLLILILVKLLLAAAMCLLIFECNCKPMGGFRFHRLR
jgi:hypothetical protein